jgi:hypothetical protein
MDELVFSINLEELQMESMRFIGRILTDEEIYIAKKGLHEGLLTSIDIVYGTIFGDIIRNEKS